MISRQQLRAAVRLARRGLLDLDAFVKALVSQFIQAKADLEAAVLEAWARGDVLTVRKREAHLRLMRQRLVQLAAQAQPPSRTLMREAYRIGERVTLNATGERDPSHGRLRKSAIDILADNLENRLGDAITTVGRRLDDVFRREGLRAAMLVAASDTEDVQAAAAGMRDRLLKQGLTAFQDRRGGLWSLDTYSEMAVRTAVTDALALGTQNTLLQRDFDLVEIHSGESACPMCQPYLDKTWSMTGRAKKYPQLKNFPSYHPHCDCVMTPAPQAFDEREKFHAEQRSAA